MQQSQLEPPVIIDTISSIVLIQYHTISSIVLIQYHTTLLVVLF